MRSPLLDLPGAVPADGPDADVAAHYGDLFAEQRVLVKGEAVVDRSNREVIRIAGADRLKWLNDLTSQKLDALAPGEWTQTLLLDAQGRLEHHLTLVDDGAAVLAHVEPGASATLIDYLDRMRFMLRVEVSLVEDLAVLSSATEDYLVPRAELPDHLGRPLAGLWAYEALRIEEHRPRLGLRHRPQDDSARGGLDRPGRAPQQGLLPRPGDRRPGAQPGPPAAPPGLPAPGRQRRHAAAARRTGDLREPGGRHRRLRRPPLRAGARSPWPWSSGPFRWTPPCWREASPPPRRSSSRRTRAATSPSTQPSAAASADAQQSSSRATGDRAVVDEGDLHVGAEAAGLHVRAQRRAAPRPPRPPAARRRVPGRRPARWVGGPCARRRTG